MKLENLRSKFRYSDAFRVFAFLIVKIPFADSFMNFQFSHARLAEGFRIFGARHKGFLSKEATVIGVETRTSSPVRITRDNTTLQHVSRPGLYPCGEGAGYAGGIVSAAIDGERCAQAAASYIATHKSL